MLNWNQCNIYKIFQIAIWRCKPHQWDMDSTNLNNGYIDDGDAVLSKDGRQMRPINGTGDSYLHID